MPNYEHEKITQAEKDAFDDELLKLSALNKDLRTNPITTLDEAAQAISRIDAALGRAFNLAGKTSTLDDDKEVSKFQKRLLDSFENAVTTGTTGTTTLPEGNRIVSFARQRIYLSRAISGPSSRYAEPQKRAADYAIEEMTNLANGLPDGDPVKVELQTLLGSAKTAYDASEVAKVQPLVLDLDRHNLAPTLSQIDSDIFIIDGRDKTEVDNLLKELEGPADVVSISTTAQVPLSDAQRNVVAGVLLDVEELSDKYAGHKKALRELSKISQIIREIQHEDRVARLGGTRDPRRKDFLRPSIARKVPDKMQGLILSVIGNFDERINQAEEDGLKMGIETDPDERYSKIAAGEDAFLKLLRADLEKEKERLALQMTDSMPGDVAYKNQFSAYFDQYLNWLDRLIAAATPPAGRPPAGGGAGGAGGPGEPAAPEAGMDAGAKRDRFRFILNAITSSDDVSLSDKNNAGIKQYGAEFAKLLEEFKTAAPGTPEKNLAIYAGHRIKLFDTIMVAGKVTYVISYKDLYEGGSVSDTTVKVPGVKVEQAGLTTTDFAYLLFDSEYADPVQRAIELADTLWQGTPLPETGRGAGDGIAADTFAAWKDFGPDKKLYKEFEQTLKDRIPELNDPQTFGLFKDLVKLFDLRNMRGQEYYAAGQSPTDKSYGDTIPETTERFYPQGRVTYNIQGKGNGIFNPALALGRLSRKTMRIIYRKGTEDLANKPENRQYIPQLKQQLRNVRVWLDWFAPIPEEFVNELRESNFYDSVGGVPRDRVDPMPRLGEYYWLDPVIRERLRNHEDVTALDKYLETAENFEKFYKECITGAKPTGSPDEDKVKHAKDEEEKKKIRIETTMEKAIADAGQKISTLSSKLSGIKGLDFNSNGRSGIDGLFCARGMYIYIRQMSLAFGKEWSSQLSTEEYNLYLGMLFNQFRSAVEIAPTLGGITFDNPANPREKLSVRDYLLAKLPGSDQRLDNLPDLRGPRDEVVTQFYMYRPDGHGGWTSWVPHGAEQMKWLTSLSYDADRVHNNQHALAHLRGKVSTRREGWRVRLSKATAGGKSQESEYFDYEPTIIDDQGRPFTPGKNGVPETSHDELKAMWTGTNIPTEIVSADKASKEAAVPAK